MAEMSDEPDLIHPEEEGESTAVAVGSGVDAGVENDVDDDDRPCPCWPDYEPDLGADEFGVCRFLPLAFQKY